ncbi:hypothetical protein A3D62_00425 [Candidatus Kaiserbacteria bacterium RIFCSPHIGHO2_02_FULL_49_11]|uniref:Chaperone protein DnaJ n=1 Tax=Candidatus Kaiserbacteria bacterium RIFCSPHIGHO2_02_FULL_49_11 TaxID=1798489 RepID=A0A1F6CZ88_9BACT|nr:MAG: hypothetical protein A3D62_00425 [Candidatus Kaiserbacteria bacterium RIFCSPHIGHO2_02_FULL_49_11]
MPKDYYKTLGVSKSATKEDIKKAFHKLAHKYHPDKKTGDEKKFKEISEAYSVLSDDKKRAEYDSYGRVFSGTGGSANASGFEGFGGFDFSGFQQAGFDGVDIGDIFSEFFGGFSRRPPRGRDISIDVELSFREAVFGTERRVLLTKTITCDVCNGLGAEKGAEMEECKVCNGKGKIHENRASIFGSVTSVRPCASCRGIGRVPKVPCKNCKGLGVLRKETEAAITIPAGINNGEMVRLTGEGEAIPQGTAGDLYVKIHVHPDAQFSKEGSNLLMKLNVKLSDALLGADYVVQTLEGEPISVRIPQGVAFGEIIRVKGRGVPIIKKERGDLLVKVAIDMPGKLSATARKAIEELRKEGI